MIDTLRSISENMAIFNQHIAKDTLYIIQGNNELLFVKILPILIAGIALVFTAISIFISKRALTANITHQKLSIKPLLTNHEEFSFRNSEGSGILLKSCGLGPAIIIDFKIQWSGIDITLDNAYLITGNIGISTIELGDFVKDGIIPKDSTSWVLRILKDELSDKSPNYIQRSQMILQKLRENFSYTIVYTSIYGDEDIKYTLKYPFRKT